LRPAFDKGPRATLLGGPVAQFRAGDANKQEDVLELGSILAAGANFRIERRPSRRQMSLIVSYPQTRPENALGRQGFGR